MPNQAIEGYGCDCGSNFEDLKDFRRHLLQTNRNLKEGDVKHKSLGRVNIKTNEVVLPPYLERTQEEKMATTHAVHKNSTKGSYLAYKAEKEAQEDDDEGKKKQPREREPSAGGTTDPGSAVGLKVVPRVMTINYTNIMRTAQLAASREWKWREEMPLENFLDTCLANFFKEHGITLSGYFKEEEDGGNGNGHEIAEMREMMMELAGQVRGLTQIVHQMLPVEGG